MNREAPIGAQERGLLQIRHGLPQLYTISKHRHLVTARNLGRIDGNGGSGGGIDGSSRRRRRHARVGGVVRPRGGDDLRDTDVAAVPPGLGAELADEVGGKSEDGRGAEVNRRCGVDPTRKPGAGAGLGGSENPRRIRADGHE